MRKRTGKIYSQWNSMTAGMIVILLLIAGNWSLINASYRTPSGRRAVYYAPMAWWTNLPGQDYSIHMHNAADSQRYHWESRIQTTDPGFFSPNS